MRTATTLHSPLSKNKYAGTCCVCGRTVGAGEGYLAKNGVGGLSIHHSACLAKEMRKKAEEKK